MDTNDRIKRDPLPSELQEDRDMKPTDQDVRRYTHTGPSHTHTVPQPHGVSRGLPIGTVLEWVAGDKIPAGWVGVSQ